MIDYIIIRTQKKKDVKRCRVMRSAQCDTDHRLIRSEIMLKPKIFVSKEKPAARYDSKTIILDKTSKSTLQQLNQTSAFRTTMWNQFGPK